MTIKPSSESSVFGDPEKNKDDSGDFRDILNLEDHLIKNFSSETYEPDIAGHQTEQNLKILQSGKLSPVRLNTGRNSFTDINIMEQWRKSRELYRKKELSRNAREDSQHHKKDLPKEKQETNVSQPKRSKFQEVYEPESFHFIAPVPFLTDELKNRLLTADIEVSPDLLIMPEPEVFPAPEDGTLQVSDVMSKDVVCIIETMTIEQAASLFNRRKITGAPVVDYRTRQLVGLISLSDILFHTFESKAVSTFHNEGGSSIYQQDSLAILEKPVSAFMVTEVIQVDTECNVRDACKLMPQNNIHKVIVTKDGLVKGIFTSFDTVRLMAGFDLKIHQAKV